MNQNQESSRIDLVFSGFMKMFYYVGLTVFLPYFLLHSAHISLNELDFNVINRLILIISIIVPIFLSMDIFGMYSSYLDRISRLLTLIFTIGGAIDSIFLYFAIKKGWTTNFSNIVYFSVILFMVYGFLGWYFIRGEHGLTNKRKKPLYQTSKWILMICGVLMICEFFVPGVVILGIFISFSSYPFLIIFFGHPKVVPEIKPRKLVSSYPRATFYNFFIDGIKACAILLTIFCLIYDGTVVLYPEDILNPDLWIRNIGLVLLFAGFGMALIAKVQNRFYGLLVIIVLFILAMIEYIFVNTLYWHYWWLIAPINGFIFAGIFYFIEQKMFKSANVGAMPGSFYLLIMAIIIVSIIIRSDPIIDDTIENIKFASSIFGIAYIIGYVREAPKQKSLRMSI